METKTIAALEEAYLDATKREADLLVHLRGLRQNLPTVLDEKEKKNFDYSKFFDLVKSNDDDSINAYFTSSKLIFNESKIQDILHELCTEKTKADLAYVRTEAAIKSTENDLELAAKSSLDAYTKLRNVLFGQDH